MRLVLQSCHTSQPRRHFRETVEVPVPLARIPLDRLDQETLDTLSQLRRDHVDGAASMWGFKPTSGYQTLWQSLTSGDLIAFHMRGTVFATGRVEHRWRSRELAEQLWDVDATPSGPERSWDLMLSLTDLREGSISLQELGRALGKAFPASDIGTTTFELPEVTAAAVNTALEGFATFRQYPTTPRPATPLPGFPGGLAVFVALDEEFEVLRDRWQLRPPRGKDLLDDPTFTGTIAPGCAVRVFPALAMGRVAAALGTQQLLATPPQPPGLIVVAGLAGGFQGRHVLLEDVIVATEIVDYGVRKVYEDHLEFREKVFETDAVVVRILRALRPERTHFGPIACVDEVVASASHQEVLTGANWRKTLGIEMESGGVVAACSQQRPRVPVATIRGVCDLADKTKDDVHRSRAMLRVARTIESFVAELMRPVPAPEQLVR